MTRALVTGGGARLGRAMVLGLAARGYDVAIHYNTSADAAQEVADMVRAMGRQAVCVRADLLDDGPTAALIPDAARALGGPLTVLINNASIFEGDDFETATRESWDRHMGSNLRAPFVLTQGFAAQVAEPRSDDRGEPLAQGLIVNMVDQRVLKLTPQFTTYTLAKAALWTLTQTSAQALAPRVRVNAIAPGPTLQGARQSASDFAQQRAATVLSRGASPQEIVAALGYLLDARAVTGQLMTVDGGQHLGWETPDAMVSE
ncbi:SDR family oxidoreductase [Loktanella sp. TSTF-M6]|uniref:SDR family oxidoreductase n=1 Tax=Loktanella gaetbuli TaxID=2881335 RepID=A0ABS8BTF3_9RHOB|nr:SDR family oxidoreductase [Loktanella gaetbuli]MCB5198869.1 SDR family oxidoreductase [Loktanella gaetbuli]